MFFALVSSLLVGSSRLGPHQACPRCLGYGCDACFDTGLPVSTLFREMLENYPDFSQLEYAAALCALDESGLLDTHDATLCAQILVAQHKHAAFSPASWHY